MTVSRRTFLGLSGTIAGAGMIGGWAFWQQRQHQPLILSARNDQSGQHYAAGFYLDGRCAFQTPVATRCHDITRHPFLPIALFVGRRPSTESYLIDLRDGRLLQTLRSQTNRHFYGHAIFDASGDWLFSTENDIRDPGKGVISAYRFDGAQLLPHHEFPSYGIGPHQLAWMPDGNTIVVANGGIRTEADSRKEMNLNAMEPSLVLVSRDGRLLSKETLPEQQSSIRHLSVAADGTIVTGQQFMGDAYKEVPLLAIKRPHQPFTTFPVSHRALSEMRHYTASISINSELRQLAITAPRGNRFYIWNLDNSELLLDVAVPDCAGVGALENGFVVTSGQGKCRLFKSAGATAEHQPTSKVLTLPSGLWDNHLIC